jgi:hypothetical protein
MQIETNGTQGRDKHEIHPKVTFTQLSSIYRDCKASLNSFVHSTIVHSNLKIHTSTAPFTKALLDNVDSLIPFDSLIVLSNIESSVNLLEINKRTSSTYEEELACKSVFAEFEDIFKTGWATHTVHSSNDIAKFLGKNFKKDFNFSNSKILTTFKSSKAIDQKGNLIVCLFVTKEICNM